MRRWRCWACGDVFQDVDPAPGPVGTFCVCLECAADPDAPLRRLDDIVAAGRAGDYGPDLDDPVPDDALPVIARLRNNGGRCWDSHEAGLIQEELMRRDRRTS